MNKVLITALTCFLIAGCAGKAPRVYWGDYSETLYDLKKEPSESTATAHVVELEEIIAKSDSWGILPPPGVCAELGKTYFEQGKKDLAIQFINKESEHYPESKHLMSQLIKNIDEQGS
tara:strand:- start:1517 stop:1870 length:354 start_codon:yes stop_codon:yes gene_type:complete